MSRLGFPQNASPLLKDLEVLRVKFNIQFVGDKLKYLPPYLYLWYI